MKDNNIEENQDYEAIGLRGFGYTLFEVEESGGITEGFYGYPYFKHIIQLWPGGWVKKMKKRIERLVRRIILIILGGRNG